MVIGRREPEAECEKSVYWENLWRAVWARVEDAGSQERDGTPTGGPACGLGGSDGHGVSRRPGVGAVQLQQIKPVRIKVPLTLVGAPARICKGDPLGRYRGTIIGRANGRPIVRNSHLWGHRGRPEWKWDRLVSVTSKWTND